QMTLSNFKLKLLLFCFVAELQAAEWIGAYSDASKLKAQLAKRAKLIILKEHPGKCVMSADVILNVGVSIKDPTHACRQILCGLNGLVKFHSCGKSIAPRGCTLGNYLDSGQPYPQCCERELRCK
ncbi:CG34177, partial [Drosophila busckii]